MDEPDASVRVVSGHNYRADILALLSVLGLLGCIAALLFHATPREGLEHDALLMLLGVLTGIVKDVYGFEFGSSQPDKTGDRTALLKQLAQDKTLPPPPESPKP